MSNMESDSKVDQKLNILPRRLNYQVGAMEGYFKLDHISRCSTKKRGLNWKILSVQSALQCPVDS